MITGAGTPEATWRGWDAPASWPELEAPTGPPPLVVAPHPDDEVLGAGGLLARLGRAEIVAVTDGEASHPASTAVTPTELGKLRQLETDDALRWLGVAEPVVHRLGHPDGGIDETALAADLEALLGPGRWCLATWRADGHPDHEAVGRAAAAACAATGAKLIEYPVWTWHWAVPGDDRVPWHRCRRFPLTEGERARKRDAVSAFGSQIRPLGPASADAPILPPAVLARFDRPYEVFFA